MNKKIWILLLVFLLIAAGVIFKLYIYNPYEGEQAVLYKLGRHLRGKINDQNAKVIIAYVNGEPVTLNEWYYRYYWDAGQDKKRNLEVIVFVKMQIAAAKKKGLIPSEEERRYVLEVRPEDREKIKLIKPMLEGWGITFEEYYELMKPIWIDGMYIGKWQIYVNDAVMAGIIEDPGSVDRKLFYTQALKELGKMELKITSDGKKLGLHEKMIGEEMDIFSNY